MWAKGGDFVIKGCTDLVLEADIGASPGENTGLHIGSKDPMLKMPVNGLK